MVIVSGLARSGGMREEEEEGGLFMTHYAKAIARAFPAAVHCAPLRAALHKSPRRRAAVDAPVCVYRVCNARYIQSIG